MHSGTHSGGLRVVHRNDVHGAEQLDDADGLLEEEEGEAGVGHEHEQGVPEHGQQVGARPANAQTKGERAQGGGAGRGSF